MLLLSKARFEGIQQMRSWVATPDFLCSLVAPAHFMRLSLKKAAYAVASSAAYRKSAYAPSFSAQVRSGEHGAPVLCSSGFAMTRTSQGRLKVARDEPGFQLTGARTDSSRI